MHTRLYGLREAAGLIGVSPASLKYQCMYGRVGDVTLRAPNGSRLFTDADLQRIATQLGRKLGGGGK